MSLLLSANGVPVTSLLVAPVGPGASSVFVAARMDGLMHSCDGGRTWAAASLPPKLPPDSPVLCLGAFARGAGIRILAGTAGDVLLSSVDGLAWRALTVPVSPSPVVTALIELTGDGDVPVTLAGTAQDGVFLFEDPEGEWRAPNLGLADAHVLCLLQTSTTGGDVAILAGVETGLFVSRTGGWSWDGLIVPGGYDPVLAAVESLPGVLWVGTERSGLLTLSLVDGAWSQVGADVITGPVNQLLVLDPFNTRRMLVASEGQLALFTSQGEVLWRQRVSTDASITALAAIDLATVLVGLSSGAILTVDFAELQERAARRRRSVD